MTEPTGSAGAPGPEPGANSEDPFASLFRDPPRADPAAQPGSGAGGGGGAGSDGSGGERRWGAAPAAAQQPWMPEPDRGYPGAGGPAGQGGPAKPTEPAGPSGPAVGPGGFGGSGGPGSTPGATPGVTPVGQVLPTQPFTLPRSAQASAMEETGISPVVPPDYDDFGDFGSYGGGQAGRTQAGQPGQGGPGGQGGQGGQGNQGDQYAEPEWEPSRPEQPGRSKKKAALVAGGAVGTAAVVGLAVVLMTQGGGASPGAAGHKQAAPIPTPTVGFAPTGKTTAEDAAQTAQVFLKAWAKGDYQAAANYTDDPTDALTALQTYQSGLGASKVTLTPLAASTSTPTATPTPSSSSTSATAGPTSTATAAPSGTQSFSVRVVVAPPASASGASSGATTSAGASAGPSTPATAAGAGADAGTATATGAPVPETATWSYTSTLTSYLKGGRWYVKWTPDVLAPNLTSAEHLATVAVAPGVGEITDADGGNLDTIDDPGVENIVSYLKQHAPVGSGTPGIAVELVDSTGKAVSGTEDVIKPAVNAPSLATTIDPHIESLAEHAVQHKSGSSMVVIRPSTGAILAVANNDGGKDDALGSREAPGSTMKIVTATALFNYGVLTPQTGVACPPTETIQGVVYHNSEGDQEPPGTPFLVDFAQSCNNAFDSEYTNLENLRLEGTAANTYGLNQPWDIGLGPATYFTMPTDSSDESGSELAQEAFGQGKVSASPLAMASVAATVDTGSFHQPYLLASVTKKVTATPLPSSSQAYLKQVMRAVISNPLGTAYGIPFASDIYGKTGTAEHGPTNMSPNAWFDAVDPNQDVAACALVLDNTLNQDNYGATNAAPEVLSLFDGL